MNRVKHAWTQMSRSHEMLTFCPAVNIPARDPVQLDLIQIVVASIPAKLTNQLVRQLCSVHPLPPSLKHLKRVRKDESTESGHKGNTIQMLDIILCCHSSSSTPCTPGDAELGSEPEEDANVVASLPEPLARLVAEHQLRPFLALAPTHAPETREQWTKWCSVWPVTWKVPELGALSAAAAAIPLPAAEQLYLERHMAAALRLAASTNSPAAGAATATCSSRGNAALIVDPIRGLVVAQAVARCGHPLGHATMEAIAAAAERDRRCWPSLAGEGGAPSAPAGPDPGSVPSLTSPTDAANTSATGQAADDDAAAPGACDAASGEPSGKRPRLSGEPHDALMPAASDMAENLCKPSRDALAGFTSFALDAARGPSCEPAASSGSFDPAPAGASASCRGAAPLAAAPARGSISAGERPYMCTGYDCFLVQEPCIMCAMALVHSRLSRIVFCTVDSGHGALGGGPCERLHSRRSLNHHYLVYHLPLRGADGT